MGDRRDASFVRSHENEEPGVIRQLPLMEENETLRLAACAETLTLQIRRAEDIAPALETIKGRVEALYVIGDPLTNTQQLRIVTLALSMRLPTIHDVRESVLAGALMSYGANRLNSYRRAAELVDKILRGAKPGDIPVEQPTKFELVVNLITAKALGLAVPLNLLALAGEVIE
jgi:putative ABC transport system substrate-binding protein